MAEILQILLMPCYDSACRYHVHASYKLVQCGEALLGFAEKPAFLEHAATGRTTFAARARRWWQLKPRQLQNTNFCSSGDMKRQSDTASGCHSPRPPFPPLGLNVRRYPGKSIRVCLCFFCPCAKHKESCCTVGASGYEMRSPQARFIRLIASHPAVAPFESCCKLARRKGAVPASSLFVSCHAVNQLGFAFRFLQVIPRQLLLRAARPPCYHYMTEVTEPGPVMPSLM